MKAKFTLITLSILPFIATACQCLWIESFCEAITPQSNVSTFKIIEKFSSQDSLRTYFVAEKIEDLVGSVNNDTMTILAGYGHSCDPNYYSIKSGDSMVINIETPSWMPGNIPYDSDLGHLCSKKFLRIENGKIHDGISDDYDQTIDYSDFKINIVNCANLTILDNPKILDNVLFIYPNPTKDLLNVGLNFNSNFNYQIYNVSGRLISQEQKVNRNHEIDLSHFQKGVYFIKIFVNKSFAVRKFVKL